MKRILIILLVAVSYQMIAQPEGRPRLEKARQKVETMRVAFISEKLNLTTDEAQRFWPVYNAYKEEEKQIRVDKRPDKMPEDMTEKEAEQFIIDRFSSQERQLALDRKYYVKLKDVISVKRIAILYQAENEFKLRLVNVMKNRKNGALRGGGLLPPDKF
ncbi:MAG TPA: hypothetical protein VK590_09610 [Saprospiraceae bacterium]|nr:hypothetical protein [Saprospiraceae bacterium]